MSRVRTLMIAVVVAGLTAAVFPAAAPADDTAAIVTMIDGKAHVYNKGDSTGTPLKRKDPVRTGQEIRVGERSRLELKYPDGTFMRFSERSTVKMEELSYDRKTQEKSVRVSMVIGKLWARVKRLMTTDSRVEVKTVNAVAGVRGTTYRVNVEEDNSALIRVYDGSVDVKGVQTSAAAAPPQGLAPVPVPGPHEVPPPYHEVTMEEWHVIVKSFQQVTISAQGIASEPQDFNPQQDQDDWVKWNQERDSRTRQ